LWGDRTLEPTGMDANFKDMYISVHFVRINTDIYMYVGL